MLELKVKYSATANDRKIQKEESHILEKVIW